MVLPVDHIGAQITDVTLAVLTGRDARVGLGLELRQETVGFASLAKPFDPVLRLAPFGGRSFAGIRRRPMRR
jgi:hypothetical protein